MRSALLLNLESKTIPEGCSQLKEVASSPGHLRAEPFTEQPHLPSGHVVPPFTLPTAAEYFYTEFGGRNPCSVNV